MNYFIDAVAPFVFLVIFHAILIAIIWSIRWALMVNFSVFAFTSVLYGFILGLLGIFYTPQFEFVIQSFGYDLPVLTKLVINFRYLLWIPPLLIAIFWLPLRSNAARNKYYLVCFLGEAILLSAVVWALSLPFFVFGEVV
ncbi:MAG: hypothetical protein LBI48_12860 [Burkholderiaceae bacterium]|jgi:hypothetical protein|nr:hypothetical protein [Burkholderiaceae bacterium]